MNMPKTGEIRFIGDMQRLELKPDDLLVLRSNHRITEDQVEVLRRIIETTFPGHKVIMLEEGMELGAIGKTE